MIQASIGPSRVIRGNTIWRTLANTSSSDQAPWPTKCNNEIVAKWARPIRVPDHAHKLLDIAGKTRFNVFRSVQTHPNPLVSVGFASINDSHMRETAAF
jgi:hypothetical protein